MKLSYLWSREFLLNRTILWLLFICNLLGTIYGYIWYGSQLDYTVQNYPLWLIVFVPDSPTASLFFTITLLFLLFEKSLGRFLIPRMVIEALAVVTSVKYGIWAVAMIFGGAYYGNVLEWEDWMLTASHLAMVVESLLFVRFFQLIPGIITVALAWTLLNDTVDYSYGVYPYLPGQLEYHLTAVQNFTFILTVLSALAAWVAIKQARKYSQSLTKLIKN